LLILLACLLGLSLQAAESPNSKVDVAELENAITQIEGDASLEEAEKEKLLTSLRRTQSLLESAREYRQKSESYEEARKTGSERAAKLHAELEKAVAQAKEPTAAGGSLAEVMGAVQQDKAELAAANTMFGEITSQLQTESTRGNEIRAQMADIKKSQAELAEQAKVAESAEESRSEIARRWALQAEAEANAAEIKMLDAELLSQPMRLDLLKARQDSTAYQVRTLQAQIKANEAFAIELRKGEAEKALSEAESALEEAAGKHPLIQQLAERNTELSAHASALASMLEKARADETLAREEADRFESDLQTIQRKLEIVGMSRAMGQVLREQQMRLPNRRYSGASTSSLEKQISESSLRQFEYEEERRQLRDIPAYVERLTANLPAEEGQQLKPDLSELAKTRRDLVTQVIDAENTYLRTLGEMEFTARRLLASADAYSAFISQRLLWILGTVVEAAGPVFWFRGSAVVAACLRRAVTQPWTPV
jgi:potassium efflux system protein